MKAVIREGCGGSATLPGGIFVLWAWIMIRETRVKYISSSCRWHARPLSPCRCWVCLGSSRQLPGVTRPQQREWRGTRPWGGTYVGRAAQSPRFGLTTGQSPAPLHTTVTPFRFLSHHLVTELRDPPSSGVFPGV